MKEYDFSSIITMKLIVSVTIIVIIFYLLINIFGQRFINILLEVLEIIVYDIYYVFHLTSFLKDLKFDRRNDRI